MSRFARSFCAVLLCLGLCVAGYAEPTARLAKRHSSGTSRTSARKTVSHKKAHTAAKKTTHVKSSSKVHTSARTSSRQRRSGRTVLAVRRTRRHHHRYVEHFTASSYADNLTLGDVTAGEDPVVRAAAIEALGNMNGTVVAINPDNGRILAMVNQQLALSRGAEPCSTIKLSVALAALEEGIIRKDTPVKLGHGYKVDLTYALAKSINPYFEVLGRTLGFERVKHYANQFGRGELAGYHIQGEQLGVYPDQPLPEKL